jgi:hypothetical protein
VIARLMIDDQFGGPYLGYRSRDLSDEELAVLIDTMILRLSQLNHDFSNGCGLSVDEQESRECLVRMVEWIQKENNHE